ncbi:hypothetical protein PR202_gb04244 [Eleusine coracana subsp. coracana]|uniref:WRKY domain-containing protein n=1 Tax=Eleusine coracana subsp. coracana TaxID=191504 RepID=A0AAV5E434_ELECO|nr:hypothetical protein PR202_gb04244 [Eleusine coracana subsp. coracana]
MQGEDEEGATDGAAAVWPGELDEQLISELLSDDSFLGALQQVPGGGADTGPPAGAAPAPCSSGGCAAAERDDELPQPAEVSRALCSVYSGPTIQDIEQALSSRPGHWSSRRYSSPSTISRFGTASRAAPESNKYTTKVRSCAGKTPSDGFKWRKYGQKSIKNNPYPRCKDYSLKLSCLILRVLTRTPYSTSRLQ